MAEILQGKKFKCAFCGGSGIQPRFLHSRCIACRGKGEVEFDGPAIQCPACQGKGTAPGSLTLSCIRCAGLGVMEKRSAGKDAADIIGKRLGEITKRLEWTRQETEKKTKEVEKRLKPIKPFIKELKKETLKYSKLTSGQAQWLKELGNKIKKGWQSLWED